MFVFENIELENIVTYKKATFPLNKHPLTVIRGKNLDRGIRGNSSKYCHSCLDTDSLKS